jgi:outer membrane protein
MKQIRLFLLIALMALTSIGVSAQKFGHLNSRLLLMEMPEIKSADSEIEAYSKQLLSQGETMVSAFETNYQAYVAEANEGKLSALDMQKKEAALRTEQEGIKKFEIDMQNKLVAKKEQLYAPLLDKVKAAIDKVGKDNGYTMIFDTSVAGAIVHAQETEDVMALIKKELGIQ